jgi:hypothetical protein
MILRYSNVAVALIGQDGNASNLGLTLRALKGNGVP